jgi:hypothetical protein
LQTKVELILSGNPSLKIGMSMILR